LVHYNTLALESSSQGSSTRSDTKMSPARAVHERIRQLLLLLVAIGAVVFALGLTAFIVCLAMNAKDADAFRVYSFISLGACVCLTFLVASAFRTTIDVKRHMTYVSDTRDTTVDSMRQESKLEMQRAAELKASVKAEILKREFAFTLRHAKTIHDLEAKVKDMGILEAKLKEAQLAYDSLSALFQQRVYSLSDLDGQASARLSVDMRESLLVAPHPVVVDRVHEGIPEKVFEHAFHDVARNILDQKASSQLPSDHTGWEAANRAARMIRDPDYSLKSFYTDIRLAFPELALYMARRSEQVAGSNDVSSGVSPADEYRRTVGALFCVYWLSRVDIDGKRGFSFGVDDEWLPLEPPPVKEDDPKELVKRRDFYENQEWDGLMQLFVDAGMLTRSESGTIEVCEERMLAMLALTAIHDLMKVEALLPRVAEEHAPYNGYKAGDTINDHDMALGYVLDHYPHCLPSYAGLPEAQQKSVRFTQSKMSFNHGWLVQAEAPPEALFSKFKTVAQEGGASPPDIAFYFSHWLTDLAGAVPTPLEGSEKFVLQFPRPVLGSFIRSFGVLNELAVKTETQVFEQFLVDWWAENEAKLGPAPEGTHSIAIMRLVVQAQSEAAQRAIMHAYNALHPEDKKVLGEEMANSGIHGQLYQRSPSKNKGGPALLVYYSPAFVRSLAPDQALAALSLLAEIYRRARQLWPPTPGLTGSVTVRIDQVKELKLSEIQHVYGFGDTWALTRRNDMEAVLERIPVDVLAERPKDKTKVLKFWRRAVSMKDQISTAMQLSMGSTDNSPTSGSRCSQSGRGTPSNMSVGTSVRDWV